MSSRTIVEFNHDYGHNIKDDPDAFMALLLLMINSGSQARGVAESLESFGVTVTPTMHHSDDRKLVTKYQEFKF